MRRPVPRVLHTMSPDLSEVLQTNREIEAHCRSQRLRKQRLRALTYHPFGYVTAGVTSA